MKDSDHRGDSADHPGRQSHTFHAQTLAAQRNDPQDDDHGFRDQHAVARADEAHQRDQGQRDAVRRTRPTIERETNVSCRSSAAKINGKSEPTKVSGKTSDRSLKTWTVS